MITQRIEIQKEYINSRKHREVRRKLTPQEWDLYSSRVQDKDLDYMQRQALSLKLFLEAEQPVIFPDSNIPCQRTIIEFPDTYTEQEKEQIKANFYVHEKGKVTNLGCDYGTVISEGLEGRRLRALNSMRKENITDKQKAFLKCAIDTIESVEAFADKYAAALHEAGQTKNSTQIREGIRYGAKNFLQALQVFRILHFAVWCTGNYHNTVGRFDQYMLPFLQKDIDNKVLTYDEAQEHLEDFFLSFNRDCDLYYSLKWGDNGQSMVLGGLTPEGENGVNKLTTMCLQASLDIMQIDPKINLRVDKNTPIELYELGTQLTKAGLGFPQYSNDDVVIPGLIKLGYAPEHARNYIVAACWELIVPYVAIDIPNIADMPLAVLANECIREDLIDCRSFDELLEKFYLKMRARAEEKIPKLGPLFMEPSPFQSVLMSNCLDEAKDISEGALYNNYGFHGSGFSCAVDQFASVKKFIYEDKSITKEELITALKNNFEGYEELQKALRNDGPKLGREEEVTLLADKVLGLFSSSLRGFKNERGGIFRAGTGSAMYYLWSGEKLEATADGRGKGQPLPTNFSPSLLLRNAGIVSVLKAMALPSLIDAVNGGPVTIEFHDTVFKNEEGTKKVAQLMQYYISQGGHQLQLSSVNKEKLLEAQKHPEEHRDLIVRVWGWSGYFVELDLGYQNQIISRKEYGE